jgi:hypothetical protein
MEIVFMVRNIAQARQYGYTFYKRLAKVPSRGIDGGTRG